MERIKYKIEKNYDFKINSVEKVKNSYKLNTDRGEKCFKVSKYDEEQYRFIIDAISYLTCKGFKGIIPIQNTIDKNKYIRIDNCFGFITEWVDAREADYKNPADLILCIKALSNLHISSRGFKPSYKLKGRSLYGKWPLKFKSSSCLFLNFKTIIEGKEKRSPFDNLYLKYFDVHYRQGYRAIKDIEASNYNSIMKEHKELCEFCHHDTANHNFLISEDLNVYIIDFDYCIYDSHLHDLGSILIRSLKYGNWSKDRFFNIISLYSEDIPVGYDELEVIYAFMEFPQDFWQVGLQYYVEKQPWGEEPFLKKLRRICEDSCYRLEFLGEISKCLKGGRGCGNI